MKQKLTTLITILGVFFTGFSFVFGDSGIPSVSSISYGNKSTQETGMWYVLFGKNLAKKRVNDSFHHDMFISYATPYTDDGSDPKSCDDAKSEKKFPRDDYNQKNPLKSNESQALVVDVLDSYGNMNMSIFDSVRAKEGRKVRFCVYDLSDNVIFDRIISTDFKNCLKDLQKEGGIKFDGVSSEIDNAHTTLILDTKNCKSMPLSVSFYSEKKAEALAGDGIIASLVGLVNPAFGIALISGSIVDKLGTLLPLHLSVNRNKEDYIELVPEKDKVKVSIKLSDQGCFTGQDPDCLIWTKVALPSDGAIASTAGFLGEEYKKAQTQGDDYKIANAYKKGVIMSECSGATGCSSFPSPWEIIKVTGAKTSYGKTLEVGVNQANYDKNSPCYSSELGEYKPGCYEFLAPIDFDANGGNLNGVQSKEGRTWIENIREFRFGDYVNFLFRIAISALVIISVVMIMVAGIEYMTVESLFGKSQAKARIKGAVGGLILALASYTILHTLNPKLLDMSALDNMEVAKVGGDEPATIDKNGSIICKGGPRKYNGVLLKTGKSQEWKPETFGKKAGDWIDVRDLIKQGKYDDVIKIKNGKCTYVGDACTSMKFEGPVASKVYSALVNLANDLQLRKNKKTIVITGGSEMWKHCTHGPSSPILDIRSNSTGGNDEIGLAKLFAGDDASGFPAQCFDRTNLGLSYVSLAKDETLPSTYKKTRKSGIIKKKDSKVKDAGCSWKPADHWHIIFK